MTLCPRAPALYGVQTRVLNQAIKRNLDRFPADFMFRLPARELETWRSQVVISKPDARTGLCRAPFAFTEHGTLWPPWYSTPRAPPRCRSTWCAPLSSCATLSLRTRNSPSASMSWNQDSKGNSLPTTRSL